MKPTPDLICAHLDLSPRQLRGLLSEGILTSRMDLDQCRLAYIAHLRLVAGGKRPAIVDRREQFLDRELDRLLSQL